MSQHLITNEILLQDSKNMKMSLSFGEANTSNVYKYAIMNFKATMPGAAESKLTMWTDKDIFNMSCLKLTHRDGMIWSQYQQGPESGMNADMVDGYQGYQLKNALGANNFLQAFQVPAVSTVPGRRYVKVLTLKPSRIGNPIDFKTDGTAPYDIIQALENQTAREQFTQEVLNNPRGSQAFTSTNALQKRVLNATFRGNITYLTLDKMESVDLHIGLFEDPLSRATDNSKIEPMFYISSHGSEVPYMADFNGTPRPPLTYPSKFPAPSNTTKSYNEVFSSFKLIAGPTTTQTIDGTTIYTHTFELYAAVDKKAELQINPYASAQCIVHEYQPPVALSTLSTNWVIEPKNINDLRYAENTHRHYDYEKAVDDIHNTELPKKVDKVDNTRQGNKVIVSGTTKEITEHDVNTNELGTLLNARSNIQAQIDTKQNKIMESGQTNRVLIADNNNTITQSTISTTELSNLSNSKSNIQEQIDGQEGRFVKKSGDTMVGDLAVAAAIYTNALHITNRELIITNSLPANASAGTVIIVV